MEIPVERLLTLIYRAYTYGKPNPGQIDISVSQDVFEEYKNHVDGIIRFLPGELVYDGDRLVDQDEFVKSVLMFKGAKMYTNYDYPPKTVYFRAVNKGADDQ